MSCKATFIQEGKKNLKTTDMFWQHLIWDVETKNPQRDSELINKT